MLLAAIAVWCCVAAQRRHSATPQQQPAAAAVVTAPAVFDGLATFYADAFEGGTMADGGRFEMNDATITASNGWPLGTLLRVRRLPGSPWDATLSDAERERFYGTAITVVVRDRGDFHHALDLSRAAFAQLGRPDEGVIRVQIEPLPEPLAATDTDQR